VKCHIWTGSPIKDRKEQEALTRAPTKKKYCKGTKNYKNKKYKKNATKINFFFKWIWLKSFNDKFDDLLETTKTGATQEITADDSVLIQYSIKTTKVLYVGQVEENETFTHKVKVMQTSQLAFSYTGKEWSRKGRKCGESSVTNCFRSDSTHYNTEIL
jgi:hypothetical protein